MPNRTGLPGRVGVMTDPKRKASDAFDRAENGCLGRDGSVSPSAGDKNDYMVIDPRVAIISSNDGILVDMEAKMSVKSYREYTREMLVCILPSNVNCSWTEYHLPVVDPRGFIPDSWRKLLDDNPSVAVTPADTEAILVEAAKDAIDETMGRFHIDMVNGLKYDTGVNRDSFGANGLTTCMKELPDCDVAFGMSRNGRRAANGRSAWWLLDYPERFEGSRSPRQLLRKSGWTRLSQVVSCFTKPSVTDVSLIPVARMSRSRSKVTTRRNPCGSSCPRVCSSRDCCR